MTLHSLGTLAPTIATFGDMEGRGWRGLQVLGSIASVFGGLVFFAILAAILYFLLRFLIIGTKAAQVYLDRNTPSGGPGLRPTDPRNPAPRSDPPAVPAAHEEPAAPASPASAPAAPASLASAPAAPASAESDIDSSDVAPEPQASESKDQATKVLPDPTLAAAPEFSDWASPAADAPTTPLAPLTPAKTTRTPRTPRAPRSVKPAE